MKRKGKPKGPAPGFHLPPDLWDVSALPPIRPKDYQGLPVEKSSGLILFKFHVDPKIIAKYPDWAKDLYDNPPIPDGDNLLPSLGDVMNTSAYQHLRPAVKLMHDLHNIPRLSPDQVQAVLDQPDEEIQPVVNSVFDDMFKAEPSTSTDLGSDSIDISLDSLVNMTENPYLAASRLTTTLENSGMSDLGTPSRITPGTSVQARKMGKRTATLPPGGAAMPVPKRHKGDGNGSTLGDGEQDEVDQEVSIDSAFLAGL